MESETSFSLDRKFYPSGQSVRSILDVADHESIEAEYVDILHTLIKDSGCDFVLVTRFADYRGCYPSELRARIAGNLPKKLLVSGMKLDFLGEVDVVLKMSFRKLISVTFVACNKLKISTYDVGIGATVLSGNGLIPNIDATTKYFKIDTY